MIIQLVATRLDSGRDRVPGPHGHGCVPLLGAQAVSVAVHEGYLCSLPRSLRLTRLLWLISSARSSGTGLIAAAFIAICPGYISRSVRGSYDNELVAIFALLLTFYLFVKAVNNGSLAWSVGAAFGYFYTVSAWGGYIFIINLIPIYVLVVLVTGRYSKTLYIAYNTLYILGSLLAMQIRFVDFQHVQSGEHMAAIGVSSFCRIHRIRRRLSVMKN